MRSIAIGLGLEENFFDSKINDQCHNLRLLSYPPVRSNLLENDGQARAGIHSGSSVSFHGLSCRPDFYSILYQDYGTLTLLFQDSIGGLEVQNPHTGTFVPAHPIVCIKNQSPFIYNF
jgi:isopenicillin N synthase-like dioxygenase